MIDAQVTEIYDELRRLARGYLRRTCPQGSLQPTALVHEVYLRMAHWSGFQCRTRAQFFGAAASVMRTILAEAGRRQLTLRRGGDAIRVPMGEIDDSGAGRLFDVVRLDVALSKLGQMNPDGARVLELCVFGGLTQTEAAEYLAISTATVKRRLLAARAWLFRELNSAQAPIACPKGNPSGLRRPGACPTEP